ncbi:MAG: fumarylacetoacetate hydrolase family protein [Reichenbachiella sp.]
MRLLTYKKGSELKLGIKLNHLVIDVETAASSLGIEVPKTPESLFQTGNNGIAALNKLSERPIDQLNEFGIDEENLEFGPCVPAPGKIVCVGLNYRNHAKEAGMAIPTEPVLFSKYNNTIAAQNDTIFLPKVGKEYDYEVELAFVIGKKTQNVSVEQALDHVMGYTNVNDLSARDLQLRTGQWLIGKNIDGFLPIGPYLISADEVPNPQDLTTKCWRNGELVQDSNTSDMIFSVAEIIAHISTLMTLEAGDLIITGTPEGVIFGMEEKIWLNSADEVIVEVGDFGKLSNTFSS